MRKLFYMLIALVCLSGYSQERKGFDLDYKSSESSSLIQDKNFYLLTAIQNDKAVSEILENSAVFNTIYKRQQREIGSKIDSCTTSLSCLIGGYQFNDKDLKSIKEEFQHLMKEKKQYSSLRKI
jgi:hypothetical protein